METLKHFQIEILYAIIAVSGGIARYLNSYSNGEHKFRFSILLASAFAAGFSGYMFALMGDSLALPYPMPHVMAGLGGFFGEQTLKLLLEVFSKKLK